LLLLPLPLLLLPLLPLPLLPLVPFLLLLLPSRCLKDKLIVGTFV
jgi:hypothetical protein